MEKRYPRYRYPGVRPFDTDDSPVFMGRESDLDRLMGYLQIEQTVVLHGRSGMGKSSLINAGLMPNLARESNTVAIRVRFYISGGDLQQSMTHLLLEQILFTASPFGIPDSILYQLDTRPEAKNSIWALLKSLNREQERRYVLIFDQFEEVFSWPEEQVLELKKQLAELAFGKTPAYYRDQLRQMHFGGASRLPDHEVEWLLKSLDVGLLFVVRSDRLSQLGNWSDYFPTILKNCLELRGLSRQQAEQALRIPAQLKGDFASQPFQFEPRAVEIILDYLAGAGHEIESFQLQLVGQYIEHKAVDGSITTVRPDDINSLLSGDFFANYYESALSKLPHEIRPAAGRMIEDLMVINGKRVSVSNDYILQSGFDQHIIDHLINLRLLRVEQRDNLGLYLEISSDLLLPGILQSASRRREEEAREMQARLLAEERRKAEVETLRRLRRLFSLMILIILLLLSAVVYLLFR